MVNGKTTGTKNNGKPTKLTPELREKICELISKGNRIIPSCQICGIGQRTYYDWLKRAEEELGKGLTEADSIYIEFSEKIKKAQAKSEIARIERITKAAVGGALTKRTTMTRKDGTEVVTEQYAAPQWEADGWSLERQIPDEYGKRIRTDVTVREPVQVEFTIIDSKT